MGSRYLRTRWARLKKWQVLKAVKIPSWRWQRLEPIQEYEPKITVPGQQTTRVRLSQAYGASTGVKLDSRTNCSMSATPYVPCPGPELGEWDCIHLGFTQPGHEEEEASRILKSKKQRGNCLVYIMLIDQLHCFCFCLYQTDQMFLTLYRSLR